MKHYSKIFFAVLGAFYLMSCGEDDGNTGTEDNFDRAAMLANWADNIIIPAYEDYTTKLGVLETATTAFTAAPDVALLASLRSAWLDAYDSWQKAGIYEIGKAEELTLVNFTNIYPVNAPDMEATIASGTFNLATTNSQDEQGFPAIDYLINGLAATDAEIVSVYLQETAGSNHREYLSLLVNRLDSIAGVVLNDWNGSFRDEFVDRSGSSATSSVNKLANDFLFYFERHLRTGKIGFPAGVFSTSPDAAKVEAFYSGDSRQLFMTALDALQDFFNGVQATGGQSGESLASYLDFLHEIRGGENLRVAINDQFDAIRTSASSLDSDFSVQVTNDNMAMLQTYDELQKLVILLKTDMLQTLNIRVDFVDADGD